MQLRSVKQGAGTGFQRSSLSSLPPEDVLTALRAARADAAATTNFGPYDAMEARGLSAPQWLARTLAQAALMVAATLLAGLFLFPMEAHAKWSCAEVASALEGATTASPENQDRFIREEESHS